MSVSVSVRESESQRESESESGRVRVAMVRSAVLELWNFGGPKPQSSKTALT